MLPDEIAVRLKEISDKYFERSDKQFILEEKKVGGQAKIDLYLSNDSIFLKEMEKVGFDWIKVRKCADHIVFECSDKNYILHIFEIKMTVNKPRWLEIQEQFKGAYLRAMAIAGTLNIKISDVIVYSCYRDDKTSHNFDAIVSRTANIDKNTRNAISSWNEDILCLDIFDGIVCKNKKIKLDAESCSAEYHI
jgi:hypothetical protein